MLFKNKNYTLEINEYLKEVKKINSFYTNKGFVKHENYGPFITKSKNITPYKKYKQKIYYFFKYILPLTLIIFLLTTTTFLIGYFYNVIFAYYVGCFYIIALISISIFAAIWILHIFDNKKQWEKILKKHNIIKPKKWITKGKL